MIQPNTEIITLIFITSCGQCLWLLSTHLSWDSVQVNNSQTFNYKTGAPKGYTELPRTVPAEDFKT
jgi:hypothetical protein